LKICLGLDEVRITELIFAFLLQQRNVQPYILRRNLNMKKSFEKSVVILFVMVPQR